MRISESALETVMEACEGDLRKAITYLQSAARFKGDEQVEAADMCELTGKIPDSWMDRFFRVCRSGSYERTQEMLLVRDRINSLFIYLFLN